MDVIIELDDSINQNEMKIRCKEKTELITEIENFISNLKIPKITFYKKTQEFYLNIDNILFFETNSNNINAHTTNDIYSVKFKLYELENILPKNFIRISKSTIVNINHIHSFKKNITSSSEIEFNKTYKKVFVSRSYFKNIKTKLKEKI